MTLMWCLVSFTRSHWHSYDSTLSLHCQPHHDISLHLSSCSKCLNAFITFKVTLWNVWTVCSPVFKLSAFVNLFFSLKDAHSFHSWPTGHLNIILFWADDDHGWIFSCRVSACPRSSWQMSWCLDPCRLSANIRTNGVYNHSSVWETRVNHSSFITNSEEIHCITDHRIRAMESFVREMRKVLCNGWMLVY